MKSSRKIKQFYGGKILLILVIVLTSLLSLSITLVSAQVNPTPDSQTLLPTSSIDGTISGFVDKDHGYLYLGSRLYWTGDRGDTWAEITPPDLAGSKVLAIQFIDTNRGFLLADLGGNPESPAFHLFQTLDGGATWTNQALNLPYPDGQLLSFEKYSLFFINETTGWLSLKISSGTNFSHGYLFRTDNAGLDWVLQAVPIGAPVYFVDSQSGWLAGGPAGNQLFRTKDGGNNWVSVELPDINSRLLNAIQLPYFFNNSDGLIPVLGGGGGSTQLTIYSTRDSGDTWQLSSSVDLQTERSTVSISYPGKKNRSISIADGNEIITSEGHLTSRTQVVGGLKTSPKQLFMFSGQAGFSEMNQANCFPGRLAENSSQIHCVKEYQLLRTDDGGHSWSAIVLPGINQTSMLETQDFQSGALTPASTLASTGNTQVLVGQGFDICEIASESQLADWITNSPYRAVNLYIGGVMRGCSNGSLTASFTKKMSLQGWKFIPTWVGPQAPCYAYGSNKISLDPATAYGQGVQEALKAVEQLYILGLANSDKTGSVVYYDMEYFAGLTSCWTAVNSFMNGWTEQLHAMGNTSGMYGAPTNDLFTNLYTTPKPPDVIWMARYYSGTPYYRSDASVWDIVGVANTIYNNHQRIRQYNSSHTETWGSTSLYIDSDVLDGIVATPTQVTPPACPPTSDVEGYVCNPSLSPAYTNACASGWYPIAGFNGLTTYLAENVPDSSYPLNLSTWTPSLLKEGVYKVQVYIPPHGSYSVTCSAKTLTYGKDSSAAKYVITDRYGVNTEVTADQYPVNNAWINLGAYSFAAGVTSGKVVLTNATGELLGSTNISVGAVRFLAIDPRISILNPSSKQVGGDAFTLSIQGMNFTNTSVVRWNGSDRPTTFINSYTLSTQVNQADIATIGNAQVTVYNPEAGGMTSAPSQFNIVAFADIIIPGNLQASDGTFTTKVLLTWTASNGATSYKVCRAASMAGTKDLLGSPTITTFADTTATPGLTYYFWVTACNGVGCSDYSAADSGWRSVVPVPTGLQASDGTSNAKVYLKWSASYGATSYKVYRATNASGTKNLLGNPTSVTFSDTTAIPATTYYYWVTACLSADCSGFGAANDGWRALTAPANLQASDGTSTTNVALSWNPSIGTRNYQVYRASTVDGTKTLLGSPAGTTFADTTTLPGLTFYYWVKACFWQGCSGFSAANSGWRALTPPTNLQVSDGPTYVQLSWNASIGARTYEVYRTTSLSGTKTLFGTTTALKFADTTATPGVTFYYWVKACVWSRCSDFSIAKTGWR